MLVLCRTTFLPLYYRPISLRLSFDILVIHCVHVFFSSFVLLFALKWWLVISLWNSICQQAFPLFSTYGFFVRFARPVSAFICLAYYCVLWNIDCGIPIDISATQCGSNSANYLNIKLERKKRARSERRG